MTSKTSNVSIKINNLIEEAIVQQEVNLFLEESSFQDMTDKTKKMVTKVIKLFKDPKKIDKLLSGEEAAQKRRKEYLKKYGINIDEFTRDLKEGKDISIPLKMILEELFDGILNNLDPRKLKNNTLKNMASSFIVAIFLIFSYLVTEILKNSILSDGAFLLTNLLFAPIIEETMKRVSVKYNLGGFSFFGFNYFEIQAYFKKLGSVPTFDLTIVGIMRFIGVMLHLVTWMMHVKGNLLDKYKEDFKIETDQKNKYKDVAFVEATILHSLYNLLPGFFEDTSDILAMMTAVAAGGLTILEKEKLKKEFSKIVDKFLKPLKGLKIPKKIT